MAICENGHQQTFDQTLLTDDPGAHGSFQVQNFLL
jgi:hypothetical protein